MDPSSRSANSAVKTSKEECTINLLKKYKAFQYLPYFPLNRNQKFYCLQLQQIQHRNVNIKLTLHTFSKLACPLIGRQIGVLRPLNLILLKLYWPI